MPKRNVFFISDWTGITAETLGLSLLAHFEHANFKPGRLPFINSVEKAKKALAQIDAAQTDEHGRAIIIMTLVNPEVRAVFENSPYCCLDIFSTFTRILAPELQLEPNLHVGLARRETNQEYRNRIDAINYTLAHDDGMTPAGLEQADLILVGISRSGKTPTSIYLAIQYGLRVANYPIIPEDLARMALPPSVQIHHQKVIGLTIESQRLHLIRSERRSGSAYASMENCRRETREAEALMSEASIYYLDVTARSVEEISARILQYAEAKGIIHAAQRIS